MADLQLEDSSLEGMCLRALGFQSSLRLLQLPIRFSPHIHWWRMCLHGTTYELSCLFTIWACRFCILGISIDILILSLLGPPCVTCIMLDVAGLCMPA